MQNKKIFQIFQKKVPSNHKSQADCSECQKRALYARSLVVKIPFQRKAKVPTTNLGRFWRRFALRCATYFIKMRGQTPWNKTFILSEVLWSGVGAVVAMLVLAFININIWDQEGQALLVGSMGASIMLIFGAPAAPFSQPRNVIGGHIVSALVGVFVQHFLGFEPWLASALAVSFAIVAMHLTATLHPPGGATALIAVIGSQELKSLGYSYAFLPVGMSALILVLIGIAINNLSKKRTYPLYWW